MSGMVIGTISEMLGAENNFWKMVPAPLRTICISVGGGDNHMIRASGDNPVLDPFTGSSQGRGSRPLRHGASVLTHAAAPGAWPG